MLTYNRYLLLIDILAPGGPPSPNPNKSSNLPKVREDQIMIFMTKAQQKQLEELFDTGDLSAKDNVEMVKGLLVSVGILKAGPTGQQQK